MLHGFFALYPIRLRTTVKQLNTSRYELIRRSPVSAKPENDCARYLSWITNTTQATFGTSSNLPALQLHGQHKPVTPTDSNPQSRARRGTARCDASSPAPETYPVTTVHFTPGRAKDTNHYTVLFKRNFISESVCIPTETSSPFCTPRTESQLPRPVLKKWHLFSLIYTKINSFECSLLLVTSNTWAIGKCEFHTYIFLSKQGENY